MLLDLFAQDFRIETHRSDVERIAVLQFGGVRQHDVRRRLQGIRHVHHVHEGAGCDRADELLAPDRSIVDVHGVVRRAAARQRHVRNETREAHGTRVHAVFVEVVVTEQFGRDLRAAVHRPRPLDGVLGRVDMRRLGTEGTDGGRREHGAAVLAGHFENIQQSVDLDVPGHERLALGHGGQQGREVVDRVDLVLRDNIRQLGSVPHVGLLRRPRCQQFPLGLHAGDVARNNISLREHVPDFHREFRSDLAGRTDN